MTTDPGYLRGLSPEVRAERERWVQAVEAACCARNLGIVVTLYCDTLPSCDHLWCHGAFDVLNRVVGATYEPPAMS